MPKSPRVYLKNQDFSLKAKNMPCDISSLGGERKGAASKKRAFI